MRREHQSSFASALSGVVIVAAVAFVLVLLQGCVSSAGRPECAEETVPPWWLSYRVDGLRRGKFVGAATEERGDREMAAAAATESAKRELSGWFNRRFLSVISWYATEHERANESVTGVLVQTLADELADHYVSASAVHRLEVSRRCGGRFRAYAEVEVSAENVSPEAAERIVGELSGAEFHGRTEFVRGLEARIRAELTRLIAERPDAGCLDLYARMKERQTSEKYLAALKAQCERPAELGPTEGQGRAVRGAVQPTGATSHTYSPGEACLNLYESMKRRGTSERYLAALLARCQAD